MRIDGTLSSLEVRQSSNEYDTLDCGTIGVLVEKLATVLDDVCHKKGDDD